MNRKQVEKFLKQIQDGEITIDQGVDVLKSLPYQDIGCAKLDGHRSLRQGFSEVIFCPGKSYSHLKKITQQLSSSSDPIIFTKCSPDQFIPIHDVKPEAIYYEIAKLVYIGPKFKERVTKKILCITAGTADIPIAEEAALTAEIMENPVERLYDVGVAGIHRLFQNTDKIFQANVLVVVAGMEGALTSVVGGIADKPIIAVPTSVGYGSSFEGLAALLTMLNSCSPGISVVNIDNGFGAGYLASMINQLGVRR